MDTDSELTVIRPRPGGETGSRDPEPTVIRPRPGGRRGPLAGEADEATRIRPQRPTARRPSAQCLPVPRFSTASLVDAAAPLLSLAAELHDAPADVDVNALHRRARELVGEFEAEAARAEAGPQSIQRCRYLLCCLIDETVLNTPWGEHSRWGQKSLLRTFHHETYGGARAFEMIEAELGAARKDLAFVELAYLCLSLGFQGRYRVEAGGQQRLEQLRAELYRALQAARDRYRRPLSPRAAAISGVRRRLHSFLSVWVVAAVLAASGFGLYSYYLFDLNRQSDAVVGELAALTPTRKASPVPAADARSDVRRLRRVLAPEIERGVLRLAEYPGRIALVLRAGALFDSGSARVHPAVVPVLDKVAKALEMIPGRVTVAGHTDNRPIRTARYPSNWHLSLARANAVVRYLDQAGDLAGRLLPEGRGATEPVASNDTAVGRARNRRVTIEVAQPAAGPPATAVGAARRQ